MDFYRKTERNLGRINPDFRAPTRDEAKSLPRGLPNSLCLFIPAPKTWFTPKIRPSSCIDPELVKTFAPILKPRCFQRQNAKALQLPLLPSAKDISGEKLCGCIPAKDI